jgi:hypothetical protein
MQTGPLPGDSIFIFQTAMTDQAFPNTQLPSQIRRDITRVSIFLLNPN